MSKNPMPLYHCRKSADKVALLQPLTDEELSRVCSLILEAAAPQPLGSTTPEDARSWAAKMRKRFPYSEPREYKDHQEQARQSYQRKKEKKALERQQVGAA